MSGASAKSESHEQHALREPHEQREFLVTAFSKKPAGRNSPSKDILWSEVWDVHRPLPISYPFRWVLQSHGERLRIRDLGTEGAQVVTHPIEEIAVADLERRGVIEISDEKSKCWLLIQPVHELRELEREVADGWVPRLIQAPAVSDDAAREYFKRSSIGVAAVMAVMMLVMLLIPKKDPKTEELIPEQFAKVLLSPALKKTTDASNGETRGGPAKGNVVQAFKSAAIQKTTKSLFSSKAANALLSGSTLLNTAASSAAARKIFDAKSALSKGPVAKLDVTSKSVDMVGGKSGAVGYSGGGGAAVEGQGSGMVSLGTEGVGVSEGLTKDEVGKVIREHMADVRYCYEAGLLRNPGLEGKVVLAFTVGPKGIVTTAKVREASNDPVLDQCILQKLLKWKFPKPRGGVGVDISYPFIFKVLGG